MRKYTHILLGVALLVFALAPVLIHRAPYESTMGLVQKIFYFHLPGALMMLFIALFAGVMSGIFLFTKKPWADHYALAAAEQVVLFGAMTLVTGPLWARKAWGVWWQWDARLTSTLVMWLVFQSYILLRRYGGPGSERLSAAVAIFGAALVPFVYWSVNMWRTVHPTTNVVPTLDPSMRGPFLFCVLAFFCLYALLLTTRTALETRRAELEALYLALED